MLRITRTAGESSPIGALQADILPDEPNALLVHSGIPDWIADPITKQRVNVEGTLPMPSHCPHCRKPLPPGLALAAARDGYPTQQLVVVECPHEKTYVFLTRERGP